MNSIAWFNFLSWAVVSCSLKGLSAVKSASWMPTICHFRVRSTLHHWGKITGLKIETSPFFPSIIFTNILGGSPSFSSNTSHASLTGPAAKAVASAISQWVPWFSSWLKIFMIKYDQRFWGATYCKPFIEVLGTSILCAYTIYLCVMCLCCLYYIQKTPAIWQEPSGRWNPS